LHSETHEGLKMKSEPKKVKDVIYTINAPDEILTPSGVFVSVRPLYPGHSNNIPGWEVDELGGPLQPAP